MSLESSEKNIRDVIMANKPTNLHKGSKSAPIDVQQLIDNSVCAPEYLRLETCLGENDRSWKICQAKSA